MKVNIFGIELTDELIKILDNQDFELTVSKKNQADKENNPDDQKQIIKDKENNEKNIYLDKIPTRKECFYSILNNMPEYYKVKNFVEYWQKIENYDPVKLKKVFNYYNMLLRKSGKVKKVDEQKYTYMVIDRNINEDNKKTIKSLKEGKKVLLGTIK